MAVTGDDTTSSNVMITSWNTGRADKAENTRMDAVSTQPHPRVLPSVGAWMRA